MDKKQNIVIVGFIIIIGLIICSWLVSWRPVHATCYIGDDGNPDVLDGHRKDYYGFQMNIDRFNQYIILRNQVIIIDEEGEIDHVAYTKGTLWKECMLW